MPVVDITKGLLIHLPVGKAECHIYDIDIEAGYSALKTAVSVRRWRTRKDLFIPLPPKTAEYATTDLRPSVARVKRQPPTPVGGSIPTARHTKVEKVTKDQGIITVSLDEVGVIGGDDDKMRDHIRNAIRLVKDKGALAAMFDQYADLWTDDMTQLGKDQLRILAGLQSEGPPF